MKYLIISDIHSNYQALKSVIDDATKKFGNELFILCLGDIIGYGAQPNECIDLVISRTKSIVMGNHESGLIGSTDIGFFNYSAREAILWTKRVIDKRYFQIIKNFSYSFSFSDFKITHSTLQNPLYWQYITSVYEAEDEFLSDDFKISFIGHTHIPVAYEKNGDEVRILEDDLIKIEDDKRYIINVGSVGQPRDGDNRASYVIFDHDEMMVKYNRVEYDIDGAMKKIIDAKLPKILAERLRKGL